MNVPLVTKRPIEHLLKALKPVRLFQIAPFLETISGLKERAIARFTERNAFPERTVAPIDWESFAPRGAHNIALESPKSVASVPEAPASPDRIVFSPKPLSSGSGAGKGPPDPRGGGDGGGPGKRFPAPEPGAVSKEGFPKIGWPYYAVGILLSAIASFKIGTPRVFLLLGSLVAFVPIAMSAVRSPLPVLMALIVYIPYSKEIAGNMGGAVTGLNFTTVLMLIAVVALFSLKKNVVDFPLQPDYERSFRRLVLIFCLMGAISVLHTDIAVSSWGLLTAVVDYKRWVDPFLIFFFFSYLVRSEEEGRTIVYLMAVSLVFIGLGSIWEHHALAELHHRVRLRGIAGQANQMGAFYANYIFLILGFFLMKGTGLPKKAFFGFGILGCLLGLAATQSRGDALALVFGVMVFFMLRNRMLLLAFIGLLVFMVLNIQFLPQGLRARLQHTLTQQDQDGLSRGNTLDASARTRLALWTGAVRMIGEHPVFGVGYKMFPAYIYHYVPHTADTAHLRLHNRDAHNAYLLIGAEMGLPTLIVFLVLLTRMFRVAVRSYLSNVPLFWKTVSAAAICAVISLVLTNMFGSRVISLVLAGYLWALLAILLKVPGWHSVKPKAVAA